MQQQCKKTEVMFSSIFIVSDFEVLCNLQAIYSYHYTLYTLTYNLRYFNLYSCNSFMSVVLNTQQSTCKLQKRKSPKRND